ncbi:hypothetical protein M0R45_015248 [Rubus argutus]|uniref:Uncharacterized protein n=1 Tax=Rubus argutus TaxID=59490 RepID=A0AAW1XR64_RUBAR
MESCMIESFIGVKPETAIERWWTVCSAVKNPTEMFHLAVLISDAACQFFNGIDGLDVDGQDKEQTERPEEVNNLTSPLCEGSFMEEYSVVSSLHTAAPSESEPSATDSDGHGTRVIPPNQTVLDIVNGTNGAAVNRSPLHSIDSHDFHSYGQTHQAPGHDDSNPIWSSSLSIGSDHPVTNNSVPLNMASHYSRLEQGLRPLNSNANRPHHATRVTTSVWIFPVTGIGFEAVSAFFDQVSTPRKPHYALYGMLLSIGGVVVSILDLIHNAMEQNGVASANEMRWRILPEVFGLALACIQCISSALQFSFLCRHAENPVKVSLVPFLFLFVLFAFKYRNERN